MKNKRTKKILLLCLAYISLELAFYCGTWVLTKTEHFPQPVDALSRKNKRTLRKIITQRKKYITFDVNLGWTIAKNGKSKNSTANSQGIRGTKEYSNMPAQDIYRITTFGDSFTHGTEVDNESTWQVQMENSKDGLEVMNFGGRLWT